MGTKVERGRHVELNLDPTGSRDPKRFDNQVQTGQVGVSESLAETAVGRTQRTTSAKRNPS